MVPRSTKILISILSIFVLGSISIYSQTEEGFKYEPTFEEFYSNPMNIPHAGLGIFIFTDDEGEYFKEFKHLPLSLEYYYEYSRLLIRNSDNFNVAVNAGAQIIAPYFLGIRVPLGADLRIGNLARRPDKAESRGLLLGGGFEYSAFLNIEFEDLLGTKALPFARVGFGIENVIFIYQNNLEGNFLRHNFTVGMKLN